METVHSNDDRLAFTELGDAAAATADNGKDSERVVALPEEVRGGFRRRGAPAVRAALRAASRTQSTD